MYVLDPMLVTCPTSHAERSPLKAIALKNTAPPSNKEKSKDKNGWKKKRKRALFKNRISAGTERTREIKAVKKRPDLGEGEKGEE